LVLSASLLFVVVVVVSFAFLGERSLRARGGDFFLLLFFFLLVVRLFRRR
jgi:hypothetical protein